MDLKVFLKNLPAFEEFAIANIEALARHLEVADYEDGHVFIRQGEQGHALYLLLQGSVRISRKVGPGEAEHEVRDLNDGELFGILSLVADMPAQATCSARGRVQAAHLTREAFQRLFSEASPIGHHLQYMIAVQMARDIQEQNRRFRAALTQA